MKRELLHGEFPLIGMSDSTQLLIEERRNKA